MDLIRSLEFLILTKDIRGAMLRPSFGIGDAFEDRDGDEQLSFSSNCGNDPSAGLYVTSADRSLIVEPQICPRDGVSLAG